MLNNGFGSISQSYPATEDQPRVLFSVVVLSGSGVRKKTRASGQPQSSLPDFSTIVIYGNAIAFING